MKGLLLKDWYLLCRQMRLILLLMVVFACLPGLSISAFAVFYAAMLPISMLASDERSHWADLASMMPCTTGALVGSKYLLGVLLVLAVSVLSTAAQLVTSLVKSTPVSSAALLSTLIIACLVLLLGGVSFSWTYLSHSQSADEQEQQSHHQRRVYPRPSQRSPRGSS